MKKRSKVIMLTLAAAALLILLPLRSSITAKAAEPVTYSVKYYADKGWLCQPLAEFKENEGSGDLNYLRTNLKDGDALVVYSGDVSNTPLDLGTVKLSNLTVHQNANVVVNTGSVKDCYVLAGAFCAVNGDVTNAYLYGPTTCTFNDNVLNMTLYTKEDTLDESRISCNKTIGYFCVHSLSSDTNRQVFYNVKTTDLIVLDGHYNIATGKYSPTPTEEYLKAMENASSSETPAASAPSTPSTPSTPSAPASSDEYDHVPKTGDNGSVCFWLFLAAAAAGAASLALRKKQA